MVRLNSAFNKNVKIESFLNKTFDYELKTIAYLINKKQFSYLSNKPKAITNFSILAF